MRFAAVVFLVLLLFPAVGVAGPLEDGEKASARADYQTAMKLWQPLADKGDPDAEVKIGDLYFFGMGVPQNYVDAMKWFQKSAMQGNAEAQGRIGTLYRDGWGVKKDYVQAYVWYRLATKSGRPDAVFFLYEPSRQEVAKQMTSEQIADAERRATEWKPIPLPPPTPADAISIQLEDGQAAFERKDYETGRKLLQPLAVNGNAKAQAAIGAMYAYARGVPLDNGEALKWYRKAADQGNSDGEAGLGFLYHSFGYLHDTGKYVPQNYIEAYFWLTLATKAIATGSIKGSKDPNVLFISRYRDGAKKHLSPEQIEAVEKRVAEWKPTPSQPPAPAKATGKPETK